MKKTVKKGNLTVSTEEEQKNELSIFNEQFEYLPIQDRGSLFLSSHLGQLIEMSEQINQKKRDWEAQIIVFLQKNMVERFPELFLCQLSRFYLFSPELLQKHIQILNDWHLEVNFHVWTNDACKSVITERKPELNWAIEESLCDVEDRIIFKKYFSNIPLNKALGFRHEYPYHYILENAIIWNDFSLFWGYASSELGSDILALNTKIQWTKEMAMTNTKRIYFYEYLSKNIAAQHLLKDHLSFFTEKIKKVYELNQHIIPWKESYQRTLHNLKLNRGKYIENDRYCEWTEEYIQENQQNFNWELLSGNPGLPYSIELLNTYAGYWDIEQLKTNKGLFDKALAPLLTDRIVDQLLKLCY